MKGKNNQEEKQTFRINKFLALTNIAKSRRAADEIISSGEIQVNGKKATDFSLRIDPSKDVVHYKGKKIELVPDHKYVLLNKPKDCITTRNDEKGRKTVYEHLPYDYKDLLKPVGRLDRNTTGLLVFTNDGDFINLLTHPSKRVVKIYQATLDQNVTELDIEKFIKGAVLEDGEFVPDEIALLEDTNQIGIQLHSGKNRIVRRFFEHFGFKVVQLDRVFFGGLTKYKLPRGKARELSPKELRFVNNQVSANKQNNE